MKRTKTKVLSVFLSMCMIISCMVGMSVTAGAVVSPSVSKATSNLSGNGNVTADNFYQDFVEVSEEEAKAWTGAPAGNTSILLYKIDGSTLFQVIFVNGNYTDSTSTNMTISDWNMTYGSTDVYYTTGSGSSTPQTSTLTNTTTTWSGEYTVSNDVTIDGDVTVTADTTLNIAGGATVTVNGVNSQNRVINLNNGKTLTVTGGGTLTVNGAESSTDEFQRGLTLNAGTLSVVNATVNVKGGNTTYKDLSGAPGVCGSGSIKVSGGTLNVTGGNSTNKGSGGAGIYYCTIEVSGGTLNAVGGNGGENNDNGADDRPGYGGAGIKYGTVTVTGGTLTATGGAKGTGKTGASASEPKDGQGISDVSTISTEGTIKESDDNSTWSAVSGTSSTKRYVKVAAAAAFPSWTNGNVTATLDGTKLTVAKTDSAENGNMGTDGWTAVGTTTWDSVRTTITEVEIQDGVTSIGKEAFYVFSNLASVTIPSSVTSIGKSAFMGCSKLTNVTIPSGVISIGKNAFVMCSNLESVTIPNSVTSIDQAAFNGCSSLTSVTIPSSVTSIGRSAFSGCSNLATVTFEPRSAEAITTNPTLTIGKFAFNSTKNGAAVAYGTGDAVLFDDTTEIKAGDLLTTIYSTSAEKTLTWKASSSTVAVTDVSLAPTTANLTVGGDAVALTATVTPDNATDKKVKWSITGSAVTLYSDANCTAGNEIGTDATETLTVYAKGISAGSSTVTVTSNADSNKTASCAVTVKTTPAAPTTVTANHCTTKANNDGKLIGVTTDMEYKKSDAENWTAGTGSDITGLVPGTYYVRLKETETTNASGNQTLTIRPVEKTDPFVGRIYDIGDELYFGLNQYTYICDYDDDWHKVWVYDSDTLKNYNGVEYTVTTPEYSDIFGGQWSFPNALFVDYPSGLHYGPIFLGYGYTDGGEIVTGIECIGGNGTKNNPYKFKVLFKPRVEGSAEGYTGEYDGSSHGITVSVDDPDSGTTIKYGTSSGNYDLDTCPEYTDSGSYTVYYEVKADNRSALRGSADVIITKMTPTADNFTFTAPTDTVYSGDAKAADVAAKQGVTGMGEVTVKYFSDEARTTEAEPVDAGTYYVGITVAEGDIYGATADNTVLYNAAWTFEITKADPTVTAPTANTLTYNGAAQALVNAGTAEGGEMQYSLDGVTYSADIPTATAAGTYTVYFKVVGDKNHKDTKAKNVTAAIAPRVNPTPYIPSYSSNTSTTTSSSVDSASTAEPKMWAIQNDDKSSITVGWEKINGASLYSLYVRKDGELKKSLIPRRQRFASITPKTTTPSNMCSSTRSAELNTQKTAHTRLLSSFTTSPQ